MITLTSISHNFYNMAIETSNGRKFSVRMYATELHDAVMNARESIVHDDELNAAAGIAGGLPDYVQASPTPPTPLKWTAAINTLFFAHNLGVQTCDFMFVDFKRVHVCGVDIVPISILFRGDNVPKSAAVYCNDPKNDGTDFLGFISSDSVLSDVEQDQADIDAGVELPRPLIVTPLDFHGLPRLIDRGDLLSNSDGAFVKVVTNVSTNGYGRLIAAETEAINPRFLSGE